MLTTSRCMSLAAGVAALTSVSGIALAASDGAAKPAETKAADSNSPTAKPVSPPTKKALSKWTCEDFNGTDDHFKPRIVAWGAAYFQGHKKPDEVVVDIEGTDKITPLVVEACQKAPKDTLWQKIEAEVKKVF